MKDWRVWAFVIFLFLLVKGCGGCNGCDSSDDSSAERYEQSSNDSYKQPETSFSNEQDVRMYLCSHRFTSSDGFTLSFSNNANEVSLNGQPLTSYVDIRSVSSSSAVIRTQGPYGNTTFRLSVSDSDGVIEDTNDGGMYYSK